MNDDVLMCEIDLVADNLWPGYAPIVVGVMSPTITGTHYGIQRDVTWRIPLLGPESKAPNPIARRIRYWLLAILPTKILMRLFPDKLLPPGETYRVTGWRTIINGKAIACQKFSKPKVLEETDKLTLRYQAMIPNFLADVLRQS
jgi:hypothetical protein